MEQLTPGSDAAYQVLEQHFKDRAIELTIIMALQQAIIHRLSDPEAFPQLLVDEARRLTGTHLCAVFSLDGDELYAAILSGEAYPGLEPGYRMPLRQSVAELALLTGQSIRIVDTHQHGRLDAGFIQQTGLRSLVLVPLLADAEPVGVILVGNRDGKELGTHEERVLELLAPGLIIGLKTVALYRKEQERWHEAEKRRQVAEVLGDILTVINSNRPLNEILHHIGVRASQVLGCEAVVICRLQAEDQMLTVRAAYGLDSDFLTMEVPADHGAIGLATRELRPVTVPDMANFLTSPEALPLKPSQQKFMQHLAQRFRALLAVPLTVKTEVYGCIVLYYPRPRNFTSEEINLAVMFSDEAALALENARLRAQAEQAAVAAERSRLARDLHDAVTQTLFSASLIAEVLPDVWLRNLDEGKRLLEELRQLSRGALAEMRTLLLELRPSGLAEANLGDLLRQLAEALTGRTGIYAEVTVENLGTLPDEVKVALYRIAQEALNNVAKYAHATAVRLSLLAVWPSYGKKGRRTRISGVELLIEDNGRGFDPGSIPSGHLGLDIMQERAAAIGATFKVESRPGAGTRVVVVWREARQAG